MTSTTAEPLDLQVERGEQVLAGDFDFDQWRAGSTRLLEQELGSDDTLGEDFEGITYSLSVWTSGTPDTAFRRARDAGIRRGISYLRVAIEHLQTDDSHLDQSAMFDADPWREVEQLVASERWHQVASTTAVFPGQRRPYMGWPDQQRLRQGSDDQGLQV